MKTSNLVRGYAAATIAAVCYGTNPLGTLPLYAEGMNSSSVLFYRYGLAVIIFAIIMLVRGERFAIRPGHAIRTAILGTFFALSSTTLYLSFHYMAAGIASTLLFVYPVMTAVLMAAVFHEHVTWATSLSILLALVGVTLLYHGDAGEKLSTMGFMLVMVSSLLYAIYIISVQQMKLPLSSLQFTFWLLVFGWLTVFAFSIVADEPLLMMPSARAWACAALLALLPTVLSLFFMNIGIKLVGPTPAAIMGALEPVTAVVIGVFVFSESFTLRLAIGILLILSAVTLIIVKKK